MKIAHADGGAARSPSLLARSPSRGFEAVLGEAAKVHAASDHRALGFGELGMFGRSAATSVAASVNHPPAVVSIEQPADGTGSIDAPRAAPAARAIIDESVSAQGARTLFSGMVNHGPGGGRSALPAQSDVGLQTTPPVATFGPSDQVRTAASERTGTGVMRAAPRPFFRPEQFKSSDSLVAHEEDGRLSVIALTDGDAADHAHIRSRLAEVAQEFGMSLTELVLNGVANEGRFTPENRNEKWR